VLGRSDPTEPPPADPARRHPAVTHRS